MPRMTVWTCAALLAVGLSVAAISWPGSEMGAGAAAPRAIVDAARSVQPAVPRAAVVAAPAPAREDALYAVESKVRTARAAGAGEDEVYRLRTGALPARMIALITERELAEQQWLRRVDAWRAERARLDPADSAALAALRARHFSADEQARVDAYERSNVPQLILR